MDHHSKHDGRIAKTSQGHSRSIIDPAVTPGGFFSLLPQARLK